MEKQAARITISILAYESAMFRLRLRHRYKHSASTRGRKHSITVSLPEASMCLQCRNPRTSNPLRASLPHIPPLTSYDSKNASQARTACLLLHTTSMCSAPSTARHGKAWNLRAQRYSRPFIVYGFNRCSVMRQTRIIPRNVYTR